MCGRYNIDEALEREIERLVREMDRNMRQQKMGDIHPTEMAPVICKRQEYLYGISMRWGFGGIDKKPLINARAESAIEKPSFSDSVKHRRCIIPAGKFYEWNHDKQKVTFRYPKSPAIYMAGFYRMDGNEPCFVILTTAANESMSPVHDRMPLILDEKDIEPWIYEDTLVKEYLRMGSPLLERQQEYEQMSLF